MHLLKRVGPLLLGVLLDRDSSNTVYRPTFHVHNLAVEFPALTLTLMTRLATMKTGSEDAIDVRWHEDRYQEAAERLAAQSPLSLSSEIRFRDIINAYEADMATSPKILHARMFEDLVSMSIWYGEIDEARKWLRIGALTEKSHTDNESWESRVAVSLFDRRNLEHTVALETEKFGIGAVPEEQLL